MGVVAFLESSSVNTRSFPPLARSARINEKPVTLGNMVMSCAESAPPEPRS